MLVIPMYMHVHVCNVGLCITVWLSQIIMQFYYVQLTQYSLYGLKVRIYREIRVDLPFDVSIMFQA